MNSFTVKNIVRNPIQREDSTSVPFSPLVTYSYVGHPTATQN